MDWFNWHDKYDDPGSSLMRRLRNVQEQIRFALDNCPSGPLRVVSLCAGQGRDLLEVLADHPRRDDIHARLVDLDQQNTSIAKERARSVGLNQVEVATADASLTDQYLDIAPAHLVLICGLFGNISDEDVQLTIDSCTQLCREGGIVIWTRHRRPPDRVPLICEWFAKAGFDLHWLAEDDPDHGVGTHRFLGKSQPLLAGVRMFTFVGYKTLDNASH